MKRRWLKLAALLLAASMIFSSVAISAAAESKATPMAATSLETAPNEKAPSRNKTSEKKELESIASINVEADDKSPASEEIIANPVDVSVIADIQPVAEDAGDVGVTIAPVMDDTNVAQLPAEDAPEVVVPDAGNETIDGSDVDTDAVNAESPDADQNVAAEDVSETSDATADDREVTAEDDAEEVVADEQAENVDETDEPDTVAEAAEEAADQDIDAEVEEDAEETAEEDAEADVFAEPAQAFVYDGDEVGFIDVESNPFKMYAPQDGTNAELNGSVVEITYVPKNTKTYVGFYYGDVTDKESWKDYVAANDDGTYSFTVGKDKCGQAYPVAVVKADGSPTGTQYYLAIPAAEKLEEKIETAQPFEYDGDDVTFIAADGAAFGMLRPLDGTSALINGDVVEINYVPKNKTIYAGFYYGDISNPDTRTDYVSFNDDGNFAFTVSKDKCGMAYPIVPVKRSDGETTSTQYYLAIPAADKLEEKIETAQPIDYDGENVQFIKEDGDPFGMYAPQDGTSAVLNGDTVEITYVPKNTTTYIGFYYGDILYEDTWQDYVEAKEDGTYSFTVSKDYCGKAYPVAPIKKKDGKTTTTQYYLAIPGLEQETEPETPTEPSTEQATEDSQETTATTLLIEKEDGTEYRMMSVTSYTALSDGKNITITFFTNHETYAQKIYLGTTDEIGSITKAYNRAEDTSFTITVPYSSKGRKLPMVIATQNGWKNEQYYIQIPSQVTESSEPVEEAKTDENTDNTVYTPETSSDTNGTTAAVNNSTALADGVYTPDAFSFAGGTGKLTINCTQITIRDGRAYATLVFSSGNIIYVKASGSTYYPTSQTGSTSIYEVPVELNTNNQILACTTAMSQPHEVAYTIYIGLNAAANASEKQDGEEVQAEDGSTLVYRANAPVVPGLTYVGTLKTESAEYFRLHYYEDGFKVLQIALTEEAPDWDAETAMAVQAANDDADQNPVLEADDAVQTENVEESESAAQIPTVEEETDAASEETPSLYDSDIVSYLLAPEDAQLPAGAEKELIVVQVPAQHAYVASDSVLEMLKQLELMDNVAAVATADAESEETASAAENIAAAMNEIDAPISAGTIDQVDYRALLLGDIDVAIVSYDDLADLTDAAANEAIRDSIVSYGDDMGMLDIALLIDRSADEKDVKGVQDWNQIYLALMKKGE